MDNRNNESRTDAAVDSRAAAVQDQVKADHDALEASQRRVEASVPADVRNTPIENSAATGGSTLDDLSAVRANTDALRSSAASGGVLHHANPDDASTDPDAAAVQDQAKADHDALQESGRRIAASVPADVRDTPVQPADRNRR